MLNWDPTTHYKDTEVAERYDRERFTSPAGRAFNTLEKSCLRRACRDLSRTATFVDVPCGTGRLAEVLLEQGFHVTGVDISAAMLDVAKRKLGHYNERFETKVANVADLADAEPKQYDVALCARVLMHFPLAEQVAFLKSVARLARRRVIFNQSLSSPYHRFRRRVKKLIGNQPPAAYSITERELATLLDGAHLREVRRVRPLPLVSEAIYVVAEPF
jgi:2-polyprenyl-3-methyl-5-hydroxy-6-metoxy-1,4-benzoquinol methylase